MKTLDLQQGSQEWAEARAKHFTASEASAMMGASKYQSRNDLLKQKATGLVPEVSAAQQQLFDRGHAAEADARPIAERIIGDELYPVTAVSDEHGHLLASFDGITLMEDAVWEHKLYGQKLAAQVMAGELEPHYYWQLEQQLLVSGAKRCLFMCSDGSEENMAHLWYEPVPGRAEQLLAGWQQFDDDLANYEHKETSPEAKAAPMLDLPAVSVQISGDLSIVDNFGAFETALREFVEDRLITHPQTDQDFADLEGQIKTLKKAEGALDAAEAQLLSQVATVDQLKRTKDLLHKLARDNRLRAEKLVKTEKEARKLEILNGAKQALDQYVGKLEASIEQRFGNRYPIQLPTHAADFAGAMKGKRTIASLQSAVDDELAKLKIHTNATADNITANLCTLDKQAADYGFLFHDLQVIATQPADHFSLIVKSRIADHQEAEQKRLEAERERIRQEEAAKLEAKQKAEADRIRREQAAVQQAQPVDAGDLDIGGMTVNDVPEPAPRFAPPTGRASRDNSQGPIYAGADIADKTEEMVTITRREYDELLAESRMLAALVAHGVDNWIGYDDARADALSEDQTLPY